ncbi:MAG: sensor domain-containing diguanylate cyclase, partial [Cytophagaceae bacterium]
MTEQVGKGSAAQRRTVLLTTIFVAFVCVSLLVVDVWLALRARTQEIQQATVANTNLARAVSQQMDSMFSEVGNILTNLVYELERHEVDVTLIDRLQPVL